MSSYNEYTFAELGISAPAAAAVAAAPHEKKRIVRFDDVEIKRIYGDIYGDEQRRTSTLPDNSKIIAYLPGTNGKYIRLTEKMLSRHLLALGGIGCGKTNTIYFCVDGIIKQMTEDDILIVFDSKGDFYERFGNNTRSLVVGDDEFYPVKAYWNVFSELIDSDGNLLDDKKLKIRVYEILDYLSKDVENKNQPFFSIAPQDVIAMVIIAFCREARRTGDYSGLNNAELVSFFDRATAKELDQLFHRPGNEDFHSAKNYYGDPNKDLTAQALGVLGTVKVILRKSFIGPFAGGEGKSFGMSSLVRRKGGLTVFIEYDLNYGEVLGPMYGLLLDMAIKEGLGGRASRRGNVYIVIDEMRLAGELKRISDALNFGRSQNVKIIAGVQNINQLYDVYGEQNGKSIASGFMNTLCFQTYDADTRKYLADRSGETYDNLSFVSANAPCNIQRAGKVIEDWDILSLDVGEAFATFSGFAPFRFRFKEFGV